LHPLGPPGEFRRDLDESLFPPPLHFLVATLVPTLTFRLLFVFVVLRHHRRELIHINITDHPTAAWTARQIVEAFPDDTAPRYLLRDRDGTYGDEFARQVKRLGIREVLTAPRAPWQNPLAERLIGSIRRECLDHALILNEAHLRRLLSGYIAYYNTTRPHQALDNHCPRPREVEPPALGRVVAIPQVFGLHHRYTRVA
jgi:putative transposase